MEVQVRTTDGALKFFESVFEAFEYAKTDHEAWKISWTEGRSTRVRFVRVGEDTWKFYPLLVDLDLQSKRGTPDGHGTPDGIQGPLGHGTPDGIQGPLSTERR